MKHLSFLKQDDQQFLEAATALESVALDIEVTSGFISDSVALEAHEEETTGKSKLRLLAERFLEWLKKMGHLVMEKLGVLRDTIKKVLAKIKSYTPAQIREAQRKNKEAIAIQSDLVKEKLNESINTRLSDRQRVLFTNMLDSHKLKQANGSINSLETIFSIVKDNARDVGSLNGNSNAARIEAVVKSIKDRYGKTEAIVEMITTVYSKPESMKIDISDLAGAKIENLVKLRDTLRDKVPVLQDKVAVELDKYGRVYKKTVEAFNGSDTDDMDAVMAMSNFVALGLSKEGRVQDLTLSINLELANMLTDASAIVKYLVEDFHRFVAESHMAASTSATVISTAKRG